MKKIIGIIAVAIMFAGITSSVFAQGTATQNTPAAAKIVAPIQIALVGSNTSLNFGVMTNAGSGDVVLPTTGTPTVTSPSTVVLLPNATPAAKVPEYQVTGTGGFTYAITLPANGTITVTGPGTAMPLKDFVTSLPGTTGTLATGGTQNFKVGATLVVGTSQAGGTYTGAFDVIVNYN